MSLASRIALGGIAVACAALTLAGPATSGSSRSDPFVGCAAGETPSARVDCLTDATRGAARGRSVVDAIELLEQAATRDRQVGIDCHMALHPIGADTGSTLAAAGEPLPLERPRSFCHEGYVHGMQVAWLEAAPTTTLVRGGARACDSSHPTIDWACGHSLGHALAGRAGSGGMATAMRWCSTTYRGAVHLGLDRDAFLTTCAKGALMEVTLRDERAGRVDRTAPPCAGVDPALLQWCEGHAWLRADLGRDLAATRAERAAACVELTRSRDGRRACLGMVRLGTGDGSLDPAAVPAA